MNDNMIDRTIKRISYEILEKNKGIEDLIFLGIKTRGLYIGQRIVEFININENTNLKCYPLDVNYFRDDIKNKDTNKPTLDISIDNKVVILIDDVLYKGRTTRAALDAITYFGRAKQILLAVLVDRGHRELPIKPDFIGKNIPTSHSETVKVNLKEIDNIEGVFIY